MRRDRLPKLQETCVNGTSLAREALELLRTRPSGLLSDIDGTLSRISSDPGLAVVDPGVKASLLSLVAHFDVVGVVTGRTALEAARLVDIDGVLHLGNHGMERLRGGETVISAAALQYRDPLQRVMDAARQSVTTPLVYFENKGVSGSIHYRNAPDPALARERILEVVTPLAAREGLRLTYGRMVVELRPPIAINKGTALNDIVRETGLRSIIFMGDDVTDLDAMRELSRLRAHQKVLGLSIGVTGPETPEAVAAEADRVVNGVEGVSDFLAALVELVTHQPGQRRDDQSSDADDG